MTKTIKVSIVDDEVDLRENISGYVDAAKGFRCVGVHSNAKEALENIPKEKPDVVLMDINLGGMSGLDLQKRLCEEGVPPPIIFITGQSDIPSFGRAIDRGCVAYLYKPFDPGYLLKVIRGVVPAHH